jgi:hypothetical protein
MAYTFTPPTPIIEYEKAWSAAYKLFCIHDYSIRHAHPPGVYPAAGTCYSLEQTLNDYDSAVVQARLQIIDRFNKDSQEAACILNKWSELSWLAYSSPLDIPEQNLWANFCDGVSIEHADAPLPAHHVIEIWLNWKRFRYEVNPAMEARTLSTSTGKYEDRRLRGVLITSFKAEKQRLLLMCQKPGDSTTDEPATKTNSVGRRTISAGLNKPSPRRSKYDAVLKFAESQSTVGWTDKEIIAAWKREHPGFVLDEQSLRQARLRHKRKRDIL